MPRWASRITLEIRDIKVQRLHDMLIRDYDAEGIVPKDESYDTDQALEAFRNLWNDIYGAESWNANPWVWAIEFKILEKDKA